MWLRAHLSTFAIGTVVLLTINLLRGDGGVWADTAIGAWGVLILAHGILLLIARLLQELLANDEEQPIRPASEIQWTPQSPWTVVPQGKDSPATGGAASYGPRVPTTMDATEAAEAEAAARERASKWPRGKRKSSAEEPERVSWKAATDAAWLAPREEHTTADSAKKDDDNDFTPLKFD